MHLRLATACVLCCAAAVPARAGLTAFDNYSIEQGLPQSQVSALCASDRGVLWVGTLGGGLSRFDGRSFDTRTVSDGLPDDRIRALAEDAEGRLWIGTERGLAVSEGAGYRVVPLVASGDGPVRALLPTKDGGAWVGTARGLLRLAPRTLAPADAAPELRGVVVTALLEDRAGRLWVGTEERGLVRIEGGRARFLGTGAGANVRALLETKDGRILVASGSGAFVYEGTATPTPLPGYPPRDTHALLEDLSGNLWLGTSEAGVCRYREEETTCFSANDGVGSNTVWALARDVEGGVWLGTYRGGLSRFLGREALDPTLRRELGDALVRSVLEDRRGRLWFATPDRGVLSFDGRSARWLNRRSGLAHDFVLSVFEDRQGVLWFGTLGGLSRYDGRSVRNFGLADGLPDRVVRSVAQDREGAVWVGTNSGGVARAEGSRFRAFGVGDGLADPAVNVLYVDSDGRLWVGTERGLSMYENGRFSNASRRLGITSGSIYAIREDPLTSDLWLAVFGEGLVRVPRASLGHANGAAAQRPPPQLFTSAAGLGSDRVVSLVFDARGSLWAGTEVGVDFLRLDRGETSVKAEIVPLDAAGGAGRIECIHNAALADRSGRVWIGTLRGPLLVSPRLGTPHLPRPRVWLTGAGPQPGEWTWLPRRGAGQGLLSLPHDQGRAAFAFEGVSLSRAGRMRYQFRLDGFDTHWSPIETQGRAFYAALPPGDYTFRARASTGGPTWVETSAFRFRVLEPFWRTGWFRVLSLGGLALLVYGGHRLAVRGLTAHRRALQAEVDERQRAEERLRAHERMLETILDTIPLHVFWKDNDLRYLGVNETFARSLGFARAGDLVGKTDFDLAGAQAERYRADDRRVIESGEPRYRYLEPLTLPDGSRRWLETSKVPLRDALGKAFGVLGVYEDVTDRLQAEEALRQSEERLRAIVGSAPVVLFALDRDGRFVLSEGRGLEKMGLRPGEVVGRSVFDLYAGQPEILDPVRRALAGEEALRANVVVGDLIYDTFYAPRRDEEGGIAGVLGVAVDVSDRAQAEAALRAHELTLRESEARFRRLAEGSPDVILRIGRRGVEYVSPACVAVCGFAPEELRETHALRRLVHREDRGTLREVSRQLRAGRTRAELRIRHRDGRVVFTELSLVPLGDETGRRVAVEAVVRDVTDRQLAEEARERVERRFRALIENGSDVVSVLDGAGTIRYTSPSALGVLGHRAEEFVGRAFLDLVHPDHADRARSFIELLARTPQSSLASELQLRHGDGRWRWVGLTGTNLLAEPAVAGLVLNYRDISVQKDTEARLQHDALHDALTGLPNRALFMERLERTMRRADRNPAHRFAVLFLDLDGFKFVNDSLGHDAGDQLLVDLAPRLQACLRSADTCARLGGDEFVMLLEETGAIDGAADVAERIQQQLARPFHFDGREVTVSGSIGVVMGGPHYRRPEDVLRDADIAMYGAKARGRARHEVFDVRMREYAMARLGLESELRRALDQGELRVFYQPIVSLRSGRLLGFEALVRWAHPERGLLPPAEFVPLAEDSALITLVDRWVLRDACGQGREWRESLQAAGSLTLSVNVSSRRFASADLVDEIESVLRDSRLPPRSLRLEITESTLMGHVPTAAAVLNRLRELGVAVAVDDFGTGYSSLAYLVQLPVDCLKIDRAFVAHLSDGRGRSQIVRTIIALARGLEMGVVAEGVETRAQRARLRALGCDSGQGFLISPPLDRAAATAFIGDAHAREARRSAGPARRQ